LNGPPKALVAGVGSFVISLSTRLTEFTALDDKGKGNGSTESGCWTEGALSDLIWTGLIRNDFRIADDPGATQAE
jgi:hypothetical protein